MNLYINFYNLYLNKSYVVITIDNEPLDTYPANKTFYLNFIIRPYIGNFMSLCDHNSPLFWMCLRYILKYLWKIYFFYLLGNLGIEHENINDVI